MHRFKYYIPDVARYQRAARNALGSSRNEAFLDGDHTALAAAVYAQHCMTSVEMAAFEFTEFHAVQGVYLAKRRAINILDELKAGSNWEHQTLMAYVGNGIPNALLGAYCFDTFIIDNRIGENGNVFWAKHQFNPTWRVLTDLAAIGA
jgi:hypothetical protein